jgi:hypothetical protein
MITIITAIKSLRPGAIFSVNGGTYEGLDWFDTNAQLKPTREEVEAEIERLQVEYELIQYQRQRAPEYPDLKELADALYWSSKGDTTKLDEYYAKCEAIKLKYPKPE